MSYNATLKSGKEIYVPEWDVATSLENLTRAGKYLGADNIVGVSKLNQAAAISGLMNSPDPEQASALIKHFVCQARMSGDKISQDNIDDLFAGNLAELLEIFTHTVHAQYSAFFELGLAKAVSPTS
jgi:hypothetical protein